jgi:hypothetical protein
VERRAGVSDPHSFYADPDPVNNFKQIEIPHEAYIKLTYAHMDQGSSRNKSVVSWTIKICDKFLVALVRGEVRRVSEVWAGMVGIQEDVLQKYRTERDKCFYRRKI